jgi:hypothetical protein
MALHDNTWPTRSRELAGDELDMFRRIDGERRTGELGPDASTFVERLWRHDLVVVDASTGGGP